MPAGYTGWMARMPGVLAREGSVWGSGPGKNCPCSGLICRGVRWIAGPVHALQDEGEGGPGVFVVGGVAAVEAVNMEDRGADFLEDAGEARDAVRRDGGVPATGGEGDGHGEGEGPVLGAAPVVFGGDFVLRAAEGLRDGFLEVLVFEVVRRGVQGDDAIHEIGVEGGEGEGGRAAHRAAAEQDPFDGELGLEQRDELRQIRLRRRSHPGGFRAVIGRDEEQAGFGGGVARGAAFVAGVHCELHAVGAVAVQCDEEVAAVAGAVRLGRQEDEALRTHPRLR